jgi:hypothetical protein
MAEFTKLFEPGKMGNVILKNRIIMAPCGTHYSSHYGVVTDSRATSQHKNANGIVLSFVQIFFDSFKLLFGYLAFCVSLSSNIHLILLLRGTVF